MEIIIVKEVWRVRGLRKCGEVGALKKVRKRSATFKEGESMYVWMCECYPPISILSKSH